MLAAAGLSFQRTRTWKASPDPDYEAKAARVIALYKRAPDDGRVCPMFCVWWGVTDITVWRRGREPRSP